VLSCPLVYKDVGVRRGISGINALGNENRTWGGGGGEPGKMLCWRVGTDSMGQMDSFCNV